MTKMPIPGGQITTTEIWNPKPNEPEDVQLPEEPTEVEQKEEVRDPQDEPEWYGEGTI